MRRGESTPGWSTAPASGALELALALALGLGLLLLGFALPLQARADAGKPGAPLSGLHGPERNGDFDYAYSVGRSALTLPLGGAGAFEVALRLAGPAGRPVDARLEAPLGVSLGDLRAPRVYRLLAPAAGALSVELVSATVTPPGEHRELGALIDWVRVRSAGPGRPGAGLLAAVAALLALLWAALGVLHVAPVPRRAALLAGAAAIAALAVALRAATDARWPWAGGALLATMLGSVAVAPLVRRAGAWAAPIVATRRGAVALAALTAAAAYLPTLGHGYLSDDFQLLYFARLAAPADLWAELAPPFAAGPRPGYYRPLGLLLWWLCAQLAGGAALPQHLLSLALHALNAGLVCALALRLGAPGRAALAGGLCFALFPTHPEAVAWLASRFDLAATALTLLAGVTMLGAGRARPWLAAALTLAALLFKESAIVAPALLLALAAWRALLIERRSWRAPRTWLRIVVAALPTLAACLAYLGWRRLIFGGLGGHLVAGGEDPLRAVTPANIWLMAGRVSGFLTSPLNWGLLVEHATQAPALIWPIALLLAAALAWLLLRDSSGGQPPGPGYGTLRLLALGLAWAALAAAPLVGTGGWELATFESGRYAYLPAVGACLAFGALLANLELRVRRGPRQLSIHGWRPLLIGVILALSGAAVLAQVLKWGEASARAERYLASVESLHPALPPQSTIIARDVPNRHRGAFVLRNGLQEALRMRYGDHTLRVLDPARPGLPLEPRPPRPDRVSFLAQQDGRAVPDPEAAALLADLQLQSAVPGLVSLSWPADAGAGQSLEGGECLTITSWLPQQIDLALTLGSVRDRAGARFSLDGRALEPESRSSANEILFRTLQVSVPRSQLCLESPAPVRVERASATLAQRLNTVPETSGKTRASFTGGPELLGYDLVKTPGPIAPEQELLLLLLWSAPEPVRDDHALEVALVNANGEVMAQYAGSLAASADPTSLWRPDEYRRSVVPIVLPGPLPDGAYRLLVSLTDARSGERLATGQRADGLVELIALHASGRPGLTLWR